MDMVSWGTKEAAEPQPVAYLQRLVLSVPLLGDKGFKSTHYLPIVVQAQFTHIEHMPCVRLRLKLLIWA